MSPVANMFVVPTVAGIAPTETAAAAAAAALSAIAGGLRASAAETVRYRRVPLAESSLTFRESAKAQDRGFVEPFRDELDTNR